MKKRSLPPPRLCLHRASLSQEPFLLLLLPLRSFIPLFPPTSSTTLLLLLPSTLPLRRLSRLPPIYGQGTRRQLPSPSEFSHYSLRIVFWASCIGLRQILYHISPLFLAPLVIFPLRRLQHQQRPLLRLTSPPRPLLRPHRHPLPVPPRPPPPPPPPSSSSTSDSGA